MTRLLIILLLFPIFLNSYGQGCSDAGACSIESLNFNDASKTESHNLKLNIEQTFAAGEKFVFISQTTIGIQYKLFKNSLIELRVPFIFTSGNLGHSSGVGDLLISINQTLLSTNKSRLNIILASRLKSNNADKSFNGSALPMAYQTSLGTYDLIIGSIYSIPNWDFYFAYQHSFGGNNNGYLINDYSLPDNQQYYESNQLKRGDDVYLRGRRFFNLKNGNQILANALFIYRVEKDEILKNDEYIHLNGSEGLTVNLAVTYSKKLKKHRKLDFSLAFPVIDKDYRSDGLTRNVVFGLRLTNL